MNTELRKKQKIILEKMNNAVFGKTMENVRKQRDIKLVTTKVRGNHLVAEPSYHTTKKISDNLVAIELKRIDTHE